MGLAQISVECGYSQGTAPANDNFANRIALSGATVATTGNNVNATAEPGEPNPSGIAGGRSVWWSWTAPASGGLTLTTSGSDFDTVVTLFTGSVLSDLTLVAFNDQDPVVVTNASRITVNVTAGTAYAIAVDGYFGWTGNISLQLLLGPPETPPANDNFANAISISGSHANASGSNVGATKEIGEPNHAGVLGGKSVWWNWTAPSSGGVTLTTSGTRFDTVLGVYTGDSLAHLVFVAGNDDDPKSMTGESRATFNVRAGVTYHIAVDGYDAASGDISLRLSLGNADPVPPNDDFANRSLVSGSDVMASGSNVGATFEVGEPMHDQTFGGKSVWWTWTAPGPGIVTVDTIGSSFDTLLGVYTGSSVNNLAEIADDDEGGGSGASKVTFNTRSGITYQIAVDGWDADSGNVALHIAFTLRSYSLTLNTDPPGSGSISVSPAPDGNGQYAPGTVVTLTASPAIDNMFAFWSGDIFSFANPVQVVLDTNMAITAGFRLLPPPALSAFPRQSQKSMETNGFRFFLIGPTNYAYALDYSANLKNWIPFQTNRVNISGYIELRDASATNGQIRFYRARRMP